MRSAPSEEIIAPFVARGFNEANAKILQKSVKHGIEWEEKIRSLG